MTTTTGHHRYLYTVDRTDRDNWGYGHVTAVHVTTDSPNTTEAEIRAIAQQAATEANERTNAARWNSPTVIAPEIWFDPSTTVESEGEVASGYAIGTRIFGTWD